MAAALAPTIARTRLRRRIDVPSDVALPSLSVVIINYCQWRNTTRLVRQIRQSHVARAGEAEIIVVDNHSPRHHLLKKLRRTRGVQVRRFNRNSGFARAVNEGCRLGRGEWILLLNPDVSTPAGFLDDVDRFVDWQMRDDPRVGIVGLGVRNADGTIQPSCGLLPTLRRTLTGLFRHRARRKCQTAESRTEVPWVTGCALLIRRDCLEAIDGLDEDFFLYYEDVDLCRRATQLGWKVCFEPALQVVHHTPLHQRAVPAPLRFMTRHALVTYGLKHWPRWQTALLGGIVGIESTFRQMMAHCRGQAAEARFHVETRRVVGDLLAGRNAKARSRIKEIAGHLEAVARAQDGRTS